MTILLSSQCWQVIKPHTFLQKPFINVSLVKKLNQVSRLACTTMGQVFAEFSIYFPPNSLLSNPDCPWQLFRNHKVWRDVMWVWCGWWPHQSSMTTRLWMRDIDTGCPLLSVFTLEPSHQPLRTGCWLRVAPAVLLTPPRSWPVSTLGPHLQSPHHGSEMSSSGSHGCNINYNLTE